MKICEKLILILFFAYFMFFVVLMYFGVFTNETSNKIQALSAVLTALFTAVAAIAALKSAKSSEQSANVYYYLETRHDRNKINEALLQSNFVLNSKPYLIFHDISENTNILELAASDYDILIADKEIGLIQEIIKEVQNPLTAFEENLSKEILSFFHELKNKLGRQTGKKSGYPDGVPKNLIVSYPPVLG